MTYLSSAPPLHVGEVVHVVVTDAKDYDVVAEVLEEDDPRVSSSAPFHARRDASAIRAA
jgi:hypothetical protein